MIVVVDVQQCVNFGAGGMEIQIPKRQHELACVNCAAGVGVEPIKGRLDRPWGLQLNKPILSSKKYGHYLKVQLSHSRCH